MPWKRGTQPQRQPGQVSPFYAHFQIQSFGLVDQADPQKGFKIRCLAASDRINSGRIRLRAEGWHIRRQGAPILFQHGRDPRVGALTLGRWNKFEVQKGVGLTAEGVIDHFAEPDPRAAVVADIQAGRLTDVSVGHCPITMAIAEDHGGAYLDVQATELGEISVVTVGMDADATYEIQTASAYGFEWDEQAAAMCKCCNAVGGSDCGCRSKSGGSCSCHVDCPTCKQNQCPGRAGSQASDRGNQMDRKLLIQLLNMSGQSLKEDANDAEILAAVQRMTQDASVGVRAAHVLTAIGLDQSATLDVVKQKIAAIREPTNFVAKADYDKLLRTQRAAEIDKIIAESVNIPDGQKEFARTLLTQGLEQGIEKDKPGRKMFDTWYATLPKLQTRSITGRGAGIPPEQQHEQESDVHDEITEYDTEWCQLLGYFRDERDPKTGKVVMKAAERMAQMAEMSSQEALSLLFGQPVPETAMDRAMRQQQTAARQ